MSLDVLIVLFNSVWDVLKAQSCPCPLFPDLHFFCITKRKGEKRCDVGGEGQRLHFVLNSNSEQINISLDYSNSGKERPNKNRPKKTNKSAIEISSSSQPWSAQNFRGGRD